MLVGHNPGWEVTASLLSGQRLSMTTANVACLSHPAEDWSGIFQPGTWTLIQAHPTKGTVMLERDFAVLDLGSNETFTCW